MHGGGSTHRTGRIVAGHRDAVRFGHGRNAPGFADAAAVRNIGLDDGAGALFEQLAELPAPRQALSSGDGKRQRARHLNQAVYVLVPARFFVPIEVVVNQHAAELDGGGWSAARVQIEHDVDAIAAGLAHGFHASGRPA